MMGHKEHQIYETVSSLDLVSIQLHEKKDLFIDSSLLKFSGASALYSPNQMGGSSTKTATVTVYDTTLTIAQMPAHSHGGSTGIEDNGAIYYDVNSNPCSASRL